MPLNIDPNEERILSKLAELQGRYQQLEEQMNDPAVASNPARITPIAREYGKLRQQVKCYRRFRGLQEEYEQTEELQNDESSDADMREMASQECERLTEELRKAMDQAKESLVMSDDTSVGSIIVEIRAGTGGQEAALFAGDLYQMYTRYAENKKWKLEPIQFSPTDKGGFREVIFSVKGDGVWACLGYEGGGHRVQRVPETEAQGRIHTSAATVAVLPEPEEVDIEIKPDEVIEHVCRSNGPGGQSVNKLNSAIKLEHLPTGITVSMQDEKSQHKNRAKAWRILRSRVYDHYEKIRRAERDSTRKDMIGSGDRSQRIRTYNFPQNRVTDHRVNVSLYSLDRIMTGEMDPLIQALIDYDKQQRLENL